MAVGTVADFRFKLRYDTDANWTTQNPVLEEGEPGVNSDDYSLKLGDGITPWNDLPYVTENTVSGAVASATAAATAMIAPSRERRAPAVGGILVGEALPPIDCVSPACASRARDASSRSIRSSSAGSSGRAAA